MGVWILLAVFEVFEVRVLPPKPAPHFTAEQEVRCSCSMIGASGLILRRAAAKLAEDAGLKVVMNRCPKIELFRPFWKPRLDLEI